MACDSSNWRVLLLITVYEHVYNTFIACRTLCSASIWASEALKGLWENVVPAADNSNAGRARNSPKPAKLAPLKQCNEKNTKEKARPRVGAGGRQHRVAATALPSAWFFSTHPAMQMCMMGIFTAAIPWIPHGYDIVCIYLQWYSLIGDIWMVKYELAMPLLVTSWALAAMCKFCSVWQGASPNIFGFPDMYELIITGTKK